MSGWGASLLIRTDAHAPVHLFVVLGEFGFELRLADAVDGVEEPPFPSVASRRFRAQVGMIVRP